MYQKYIQIYKLQDQNTGYFASYSIQKKFYFDYESENTISFINIDITENTTDLQLLDYHYLYTNTFINNFTILPFFNKVNNNQILRYQNYLITLNWLNCNNPFILSFTNLKNIFYIIVNKNGTCTYTLDINKASTFNIIYN